MQGSNVTSHICYWWIDKLFTLRHSDGCSGRTTFLLELLLAGRWKITVKIGFLVFTFAIIIVVSRWKCRPPDAVLACGCVDTTSEHRASFKDRRSESSWHNGLAYSLRSSTAAEGGIKRTTVKTKCKSIRQHRHTRSSWWGGGSSWASCVRLMSILMKRTHE